MGLLGFLTRNEPLTPATSPVLAKVVETVKFDATSGVDVPWEIYGGPPQAPIAPRVSRREAMSVPAVKRGRELICNTLGTLPLRMLDSTGQPSSWTLFDQPEEDVPRSVTLIRTFEDLLFEEVAWWRVTAYNWRGYPARVVRLDPRSVNVMKNSQVFVTKAGHAGNVWEYVPDAELIRFDSPNDGILRAGARAIRAAISLDDAAKRYAEGAPPVDYFTPADNVDPADDDEVADILDNWNASRRKRSTAYVPAALKYNLAGWNPEQLQLADARQHAVLEIARLIGVDPEDLGVSTTSRTYFNAFDRKQARINDTLRGYMVAFEDRLSMRDVTPAGYAANLDLSDLLRSDDQTRMTIATTGLSTELLSRPEAREIFGAYPADDGRPEPTPVPATPAIDPSTTKEGSDA